MNTHLEGLESARANVEVGFPIVLIQDMLSEYYMNIELNPIAKSALVEAEIARGATGEELLQVNTHLAGKIGDYKRAAGHAKKLATKPSKPKSKAAPKAEAKTE